MSQVVAPIWLAWRLAWRSIFRNRRRSLITLLAITLGIGSTITLVTFARGIGHQIVQEAIYHLTGHIQIRAPGYTDDPVIDNRFSWPDPKLIEFLQSTEGLKWAPRLRIPGVVVSERETRPVTILGIDQEKERGLSVAGSKAIKGVQLDGVDDAGIIVGERMLSKLQTALAKRVVVMTQSANNQVADRGFKITGTFGTTLELVETSYLFTGINTLQKMIDSTGAISEISITLADQSKIEALREQIAREFPDLAVTAWPEIEPMAAALTKLQGAFLLIWFGIIVFAVAAGLMNTMFMSIYERIKEIALMQAIGAPRALMFSQVVCESFILLIIGAVAGTALGVLGFEIIRPGVDISKYASGAEMMGLSRVIYPQLFLKDVLQLNAILFLIGLLGVLYPAWYAANKEPLKELQR